MILSSSLTIYQCCFCVSFITGYVGQFVSVYVYRKNHTQQYLTSPISQENITYFLRRILQQTTVLFPGLLSLIPCVSLRYSAECYSCGLQHYNLITPFLLLWQYKRTELNERSFPSCFHLRCPLLPTLQHPSQSIVTHLTPSPLRYHLFSLNDHLFSQNNVLTKPDVYPQNKPTIK